MNSEFSFFWKSDWKHKKHEDPVLSSLTKRTNLIICNLMVLESMNAPRVLMLVF